MSFTLIAIGVGLLLGLTAGGYPRQALKRRWRWWVLLPIALALQLIPELTNMTQEQAIVPVLGSFAVLIVFCLANFLIVGMGVAVVGLGLNMAATAVNTGMAVDRQAIVNAGIAEPNELDALDLGSRRHLDDGNNHLMFISDIIPIAPLSEVLSFGDLIIACGAGNIMFRLIRPHSMTRRRVRSVTVQDFVPPPAPVVIDLPFEDMASPLEWTTGLKPSVIDLTGRTKEYSDFEAPIEANL